jgi:formamidopyrimidine-DNA glycosylase
LGNIYADEALFQTRLHPSETVDTFDEATWRNLHEAIQTVLRAAIDAGANPTRLDGERFMLPHRYGDERCPRHDEPFETLEVAGRTAYVCPTCQPAP